MPKVDPEAKQISREDMRALLANHPHLSPATREAALTGSVVELAGEKYQAPIAALSRPTHHSVMPIHPTPEDPQRWN